MGIKFGFRKIPDGFWVRAFGYGFKARKQPQKYVLFSERYGKHITIFNYKIYPFNV